jgi:hypothetical protein
LGYDRLTIYACAAVNTLCSASSVAQPQQECDVPQMKHAIFASGCFSLMPFSILDAAEVPIPVPRPQMSEDAPAGASACRSKLDAMYVVYKRLPPVSDPKGCAIADPVELSALPGGAALTPPAMLDCETALAVVAFLRDAAQQKAVSILGSTLKTFVQDSSYVCRTRNGSAKLSEHAYGRAIDIGAFVTATDDTITVKSADGKDKKQDAFLSAIRTAACGPFTTVLGPGSDPDHALHFHFDLEPRKGMPFCQ